MVKPQEGSGNRAREAAEPSPWVRRFVGGIPAGGRVLDVACGSGRHFPLALESNRHVIGIDRDIGGAAGWQSHPRVTLLAHDLEAGSPVPFAAASFDGVIVTNYLWRPLLPAIVAAVAPAGVLIYETFMVGQEKLGRPSNPAFLLRPGELLETVQPVLKVIAFEHVRLPSPDRIVQRIAAVGLSHPWPNLDL